MKATNIVPVILSGGKGTRLWPLSRENSPKPFLRLNDGTTLLGRARERAGLLGNEVLTVTRESYLDETRGIETQTGSYLGEDDIVRLEDVYGRVLK